MKQIWNLLLTAGFAVTVAACDAPVTASEPTGIIPKAEAGDPIPMGRIDASPDSPLLVGSVKERIDAEVAMAKEAGPVAYPALAVVQSEAPLAEKDAAARHGIERAQSLSRSTRWSVENQLAWPMLQLLLAEPEVDPETVAYYTRVLVGNGNPNADVLTAAVERAGPALSGKEASGLRRQIADVAKAYMERTCEGCALESHEFVRGLEGRNADILRVVQTIRTSER